MPVPTPANPPTACKSVVDDAVSADSAAAREADALCVVAARLVNPEDVTPDPAANNPPKVSAPHELIESTMDPPPPVRLNKLPRSISPSNPPVTPPVAEP